jgi:spoIIIJ-associated protein
MGTMEAVAAVHDLLERVVEGLGLPGPVEVRIEDETMYGVVHGEDLGLFIGRHGATIDAIQHLAHRLVLRNETELRVVVDAEGYRDRRRAVLEQQADRAADEAVEFKRPVALDAMTATERKLVHEYLRDVDGIETYSEGQEPDRHLVVAPTPSS